MGKSKPKTAEPAEPLRLDLGCGKNKRPGFIGVDVRKFDGVDVVFDLRKSPWPWKSDSVDEVYSAHFVEHLTGAERVGFWNELYRVLKPGAPAQIITPNWSHACAYGDLTHQWPPMSEWYALYLNKAWREANAPHVGLTCDFDYAVGIGWDETMLTRNDEYKMHAARHFTNSQRDLYVNLTKR